MIATDDILRQLHSQQLGAGEIAQRVDLSRSAVLLRLQGLGLRPWPEPSSPSRDAAQSFHRAAVAHLGEGVSQAAIAAILGITPARYSELLSGRRENLDSVAKWIYLWHAAGHPRLELRVRPDGAEVVPLDEGAR